MTIFSLLACPLYTCHKLSVIIKCPFKNQLTVQWRPERRCNYRANLQVTLRNEGVSLEIAEWIAFLLWPTHTRRVKNIYGTLCSLRQVFMRMLRDQIPFRPLAASFIFYCPKFNSTTLCEQPTDCLLPVLNFIEKVWSRTCLHAWPH